MGRRSHGNIIATVKSSGDQRCGIPPGAERGPWAAGAAGHRARPAWRNLVLSLLICLPVAAQESFTAPPGTISLEGRALIRLASAGDGAAVESAGPGGLIARSFETAAYRIHEVTIDGRTFRAATPLSGPRSRVVFDPVKRRFDSLLPSIRVELDRAVDLEAVAGAVNAIGTTVFESLGFAIVHLPADLHPADAIERLRSLPGEPQAAVRLRGPKIEWR